MKKKVSILISKKSFSDALVGMTSKILFGGKPPDPSFLSPFLHVLLAIAFQLMSHFNTMLVKVIHYDDLSMTL